ncbi:MAG: hypothetical protein IJ145_07135 [Prevotella sp.]|nr:hypothetical protein [Prevotella sp.]
MAEQEKWKWQEPGTTWKGVGLYHVTLTIPDRRPLLGRLEVPDDNPDKAVVRRTALGNALVDSLLDIPHYHPEVQVLHFCLMPDHLHAVLYVRRTMPTGIRGVVRGFWQGAKKLGRAWSAASSASAPNYIRGNYQGGQRYNQGKPGNYQGGQRCNQGKPGNYQGELGSSQEGQGSGLEGQRCSQEGLRGNSLREETTRLETSAASLRERVGEESYCQLSPVFTEMPFIRPMGHNTQLPNTIRYIDMNPQRLATKRQKPGFFCVQRNIVIGGRSYDGVGNTMLLMAEKMAVVHVRSALVKAAERGDAEALRNYKNSCVLAARKGAVMVSPFISPHEKQVMQVLLDEQWPFICLTDNGFRDYYKPSDALFDACAAGRVLILSPWQYDAAKRHISRADCVALNNMAEEIAQCYLTV